MFIIAEIIRSCDEILASDWSATGHMARYCALIGQFTFIIAEIVRSCAITNLITKQHSQSFCFLSLNLSLTL